jgi:hypothetical protein
LEDYYVIFIFKSPRDFVGLSLGNCPQHSKQNLPKKAGVAAHAVISKKNAKVPRLKSINSLMLSEFAILHV